MINSKSVKTILFSILGVLTFVSLFCFIVNSSKSITIVVDGIERTEQDYAGSVVNISQGNNVVLKDNSNEFLLKFFNTNEGDLRSSKDPVPVILYSGSMDPYEVMTNSSTVEEFLKEQDIEIEEDDIVIPSVNEKIIPDLEIKVKYVEKKIEYENMDIDYEIVIRYNDDLYEGDQKLIQNGKTGLRVIKREKYYENGIEIKSDIIYDNVEINPIEKIIEKGTKKRKFVDISGGNHLELVQNAYKHGSKIRFLGNEYSVSNTITVEATAFYNNGSNGNHITATGNPTFYNPNGWSTIAVDPRVIPLNTRVYVEGYGFGIAHDTGGAIKGEIIDVFMPNKNATYAWGRRRGVKVYILN